MNTEEIIEGYMGSTIVNSIYQGSELVWPEKYFGNRYMIGGIFTAPKNKIIRINDDDSIDHTWYNNSSYTSGIIWDMVYDNINKKIYACGSPVLEGGLVRYNLDGTKDNSFNIGTGFDGHIRDIILFNNKLYAGGQFNAFNGNTQNRLVRLNLDGTKDNSFNTGTGVNSTVRTIIIDNINSKIYVGGHFTTYNGSTQNRLVRLNMNGTKDTSFNIGTGFDGNVYVINIDNINSKIYVGGNFTTYKGSTQNRLVRLNMDGSVDTSFNIGTGFNDRVYVINIDNINSKIYVGGHFTTYNGSTQNRLVRLNMNGTKDTSFNIGTGFNNIIYTINIDNTNSKIYVGGDFTTYKGSTQNRLVRLNMDGSVDTSFDLQLNSSAYTILKYTE